MSEAALETATSQPVLAMQCRQAQQSNDQPPLVILHGWGSDRATFAALAEQLSSQRDVITVDLPGFGESPEWNEIELDDLLTSLAQQLPERVQLLGWSLGGMIAVAFAQRYSERVERLITLAANVSFVTRPGWKCAMAKPIYKQFAASFDADWKACLKQFCGLQAQGDAEQRSLLKTLRSFLPDQTNANWDRLLALLAEIDNRDAFAQLTVPGLHLFGEQDALVPVSCVDSLKTLNSSQQVEILNGKGHCLHLPESDALGARIESFIRDDSHQQDLLDKQRVAASFSRAANSYDGAAQFQRDMADLLFSKLPVNLASAKRVLDVGCGTGYLSGLIRERFDDCHLTALDLAPGMIDYAKQKSDAAPQPIVNEWVCGDAEALPLDDRQYDLVLSNLAYQWCEHPEQWAAELRRVLKDNNSQALLTTFAPDTLFELREAWRAVDDYVHVNRFIDLDRLRTALQQAGLDYTIEVEPQVLRYRELRELMRELKEIGAHNVNSGQNSGMTGRQRLRTLTEAYEQFRDDQGMLPATYYVVFVTVRRND